MDKRLARPGEVALMEVYMWGGTPYYNIWVEIVGDIHERRFDFETIEHAPWRPRTLKNITWLATSEDKWRFVHPSKVPDEVWAALAKKRLLDG